MRKYLSGILVALTCICLPLAAWAEKLVVATGPFPPYQYQENGKQLGINADIATEVFRQMGIEPEFRSSSFNRTLKYVETGEAGAFISLIYVKDLAEYMYYTAEPVNTLRTVIITRKDASVKLKGIRDIGSEFIGVVKGYSYGDEFNNDSYLRKQEYADDRNLIMGLARKRVKMVAAHEAPFRFISGQMGFGDEFEVAYVLLEEPMFVTFSKKMGEKGRQMADKFDETLRRLKADGTIQRLQDKTSF